jgi:hypothetical protein
VNPQSNPEERFHQVESTLEQLSNSFRHLLTAQVLMNDAQQRGEKLIERLAEQALQTSQRLDRAIEVLTDSQKHTDSKLDRLAEKVEALADSQKHTDSKLDALTDIVRQWIERSGNGAASH